MSNRFHLPLFTSAILVLLLNQPVLAQLTYKTISGRIIDKETAKPIPFANIGITGRSIGTVSNAEGNFIFKYPSTFLGDSLKVSMVGYQTFTSAFADIPDQAITISLELATIELDEVQVKAKGKTGLDIIKEAIAAIPANYDTSAIQLMAFYKEEIRLDTHEITHIESVLQANWSALVGKERHDEIKILKDRRSKPDNFITKDSNFRIWLHLNNGARNAFREGDLVRYYYKPYKYSFTNSRNFKHYQYTLRSIISDGERSTYVIEFYPKKKNSKAMVQGKLYVDVQTLAFTKWEFEVTPKGLDIENNRNALMKSIGRMIIKANIRLSYGKEMLHFAKYGDKWYLKDVQRHFEAIVNSKSRNIENSVWKADILLTVTNISKANNQLQSSEKIYSSEDSLKQADQNGFWENLNIIQPTVADSLGEFKPKTDSISKKEVNQLQLLKPSNRDNGFTRADTLRGKLSPLRTCYDVSFYDLDVKVDITNKFISGSNLIRFQVKEPFTTMQVDLYANMQIHKILYREKELPYSREYNAVFIKFPSTLEPESLQEIRIYYSGKPKEPNLAIPMDGGFLWDKDAEGNPWVQVVCQGSGASLWWPNKDHLSDEPDSINISVTVPNGLMNISNGRLRKTTQLPGNWTTYQWFVSYPINNYNVTLNIGKYAHLQDTYVTHDTLTLDYYVMPYNLEKGKVIFSQVKPMLACLERNFGKYPFQRDGFKLMESLYPMEHQSAVTFGRIPEREFRDSLDAPMGLVWHEVAHEWWGNNVSCKDVADMWIHEAFAVYSESLHMKAAFGEEGQLAFIEGLPEQVVGKEPVIGVYDVNHIHYNIEDMYSKGALMLHTFKHVLNNDKLWAEILLGIQQDLKYKTVTSQDMIDYIHTKTKTDYTYFFDQYLKYTSIPTLSLKYVYKGEIMTVSYKWNADVKDFRMPVKVTRSKNFYSFIYPTTTWQTITLPNMEPDDFLVDEANFYVNVEEEEVED